MLWRRVLITLIIIKFTLYIRVYIRSKHQRIAAKLAGNKTMKI